MLYSSAVICCRPLLMHGCHFKFSCFYIVSNCNSAFPPLNLGPYGSIQIQFIYYYYSVVKLFVVKYISISVKLRYVDV